MALMCNTKSKIFCLVTSKPHDTIAFRFLLKALWSAQMQEIEKTLPVKVTEDDKYNFKLKNEFKSDKT